MEPGQFDRADPVRPADPGDSVAGVAGEPIELPLAIGPATGYSWRLELPDGVCRIADSEGVPVERGTELGSGTGARIRVRADAGSYLITAVLARPWDPEHPIAGRQIRLTVVPGLAG